MRQAQSNRRGRGRSRKAQNPLTKNYESNGPDIKIRGTAAHISEKYNSLARDALSSSDIVRHENYMQHAEHYNRIIMAAQQNAQTNGQNANGQAVNGAAQGEDSETPVEQVAGESVGEAEAQSKGRGENRKPNRRRRPDNKGQRASNGSDNGTAGVSDKKSDAHAQIDQSSGVESAVPTDKKDADDAAA